MERIPQQPIATWNRARDAWEVPGTANLFCAHSDVFSATFPASGMTRAGTAYALPTWEEHTTATGSSYSRGLPTPRATAALTVPTPSVADSMGGHATRSGARSNERLLPTPEAKNGSAGPDYARAGREDSGGDDLVTRVTMLPTATAMDHKASGGGYSQNNRTLTDATARYLPTARAGDGEKGGPNQRGSSGDRMLPSAVQDWREYEPAIRRQEKVFGRPAPLPTELSKSGKPRLSPRFSEWLMGCPDGWIVDAPGITRNEALKAAGNGVVPQQCAAAAVRFLEDFAALQEAAS